MEDTKEQKKGEKIPEKGLNQNYTLGIRREPEEKFSCFWGDLSWK